MQHGRAHRKKGDADMVPAIHHFAQRQITFLEHEAQRLGISRAEALRRIIDAHMEKVGKEGR